MEEKERGLTIINVYDLPQVYSFDDVHGMYEDQRQGKWVHVNDCKKLLTDLKQVEFLLEKALGHMIYKKEVMEDYSAINLLADIDEYFNKK